jgi:DMSO/TMAO reductase YedYZ molybdopterin-dependent catalytic subunit
VKKAPCFARVKATKRSSTHGASLHLRIPTKLGFKNPKSIVAMEVTN